MSVHSLISPSEREYSFEQAAWPWIANGYPIVPIVQKRRARKGLIASTDRGQIDRWNRAFREANPGVVLNGLPVVVIDVDGPEGEFALTDLLDQAGCSLPMTYAETTGRGRHIYLSLPADSGLRVSQYGGTRDRPHKLDLLVTGHVVAAGARHASGRLYSALSPIVPPWELAQIPEALHHVLVARASRHDPAALFVEAPRRALTKAPGGLVPPPYVATLLQDETDGRDSRSFRALSRLKDLGWPDESIVGLFLSSPLGAKARQERPGDPAGWVMHKLDSVQQREAFDRAAYWTAAHTSGLTSAALRVLDFLLRVAGRTNGLVGIGYAKIGLGSAMDQPRPVVDTCQVARGSRLVDRREGRRHGRRATDGLPTDRPADHSDRRPHSPAPRIPGARTIQNTLPPPP